MGRVLIGFDGSPPSRRALEHARRRALVAGDELILATILPESVRDSSLSGLMPSGIQLPAQLGRTFEQNARLRLDEIAADISRSGVKVRVEVRAGPTAREFNRLAEETAATEIVIGHKAFEGAELRLGHNAEAILRAAKIPVTVVP